MEIFLILNMKSYPMSRCFNEEKLMKHNSFMGPWKVLTHEDFCAGWPYRVSNTGQVAMPPLPSTGNGHVAIHATGTIQHS